WWTGRTKATRAQVAPVGWWDKGDTHRWDGWDKGDMRTGGTGRTKVDTASPRHGGELVAEVLRAHGVPVLFTLPGGHISPVLVACEKIGIRVVDTPARGHRRLRRRRRVAALGSDPGVWGWRCHCCHLCHCLSPFVIVCHCLSLFVTLWPGRSPGHPSAPSVPGPCVNRCCRLRACATSSPTLRRAIATATGGTPGPVFVELPIDVLYPFHVVQKELGAPNPPGAVPGTIIYGICSRARWELRDPTPLPLSVPKATPEQVQLCSELLSRAQRPLVLVGSQALLPPTPAEELRSALLSLGVPCYLGGAARGLLPPECPLLLRHGRREALRQADLVLLAGTVCDFRLSYGRLFGRGAAVVAVNRDRAQLLRNADVFWKPRLAVQGDPASFVLDLARALQGFAAPKEWLERLRESDSDRDRQIRAKALVPPPCHLNPLLLLQALEQLLPPQSLLVADGGDFVGTAAYVLRPRRPLAWLDPGPFGTLGVGGGFALGAKLCRPEAEVWVLYGDGSLGFSLMEFDTFVRHKVPVIALVGNDAGWTQISREQLPLLGSAVGCRLSYSDYHAVAAALGGRGFVLDSDRVLAVLRAAQAECHQGHPVLVNALLGPSDFREGSVSV
uniref:2-hydroxyacyl-CoA lyase 2 n=1 Tax=Catharus ustulatus TaxID=91951 RepID=A0A8C3UMX3_CATUS